MSPVGKDVGQSGKMKGQHSEDSPRQSCKEEEVWTWEGAPWDNVQREQTLGLKPFKQSLAGDGRSYKRAGGSRTRMLNFHLLIGI